MRIVIDHLRHPSDLLAALSVVLETMNLPGAFDIEEHVFRRHGAAGPSPVDTAATGCPDEPFDPDPAVGMTPHTGPTPYVPCPHRGTHTRLTDCWMCWSDVMRGAALEAECLTEVAWRAGLDVA